MESEAASGTIIDIPVELQPPWERRFPGRLRYELAEFQSAGIQPEIDERALKMRRLAVTFDWQFDRSTRLRLRAIYPDSYPHVRPQVFLISGLDPLPRRHVSPEGNLCLLGRDSGQWVPSLTLYKMLVEQLENVLQGTGEEDPQGEPSEYWWNSINGSGSFCLIDSAWNLREEVEGTLLLRFIVNGEHVEERESEKIKVPVLQAYVEKVLAKDGSLLHQWTSPLPPKLKSTKNFMRVPWVRIGETIFPDPDLGKQAEELQRNYLSLRKCVPVRYDSRLMVSSFALIVPSEIQHSVFGLGWILFLEFGHPHAFKPKTGRKARKEAKILTTLPVFRAGETDTGYRVPAVNVLREKRILVVGTGAVGAPVVIELARNGCGILHLLEHDIVEPGNTVRWPLGASAWGKQKLDALLDFIANEYPGTSIQIHKNYLGQTDLAAMGDDDVLDHAFAGIDLVIDGSASHGITSLLAQRCRSEEVPLISLFATPSVDGGAVIRYGKNGGCPNCLEYAWHLKEIQPPPGLGKEDGLTQPPGCAERTFTGAGYDLQELSLQTVRLAVETLSVPISEGSVVQTLSFIDETGNRCLPKWSERKLPKHEKCQCQ